MTTQEVRRKLAAILSADVKGYSHLMSVDEVGTIQTLNAYKEVMARLIQRYHGRVVDALGDNILAEFSSVVEAVQCAVEIQKELKTRNADLPENCRMEFRIGVNLGDVVEDGDRILGDGVNIAARLESLSEAGGICICGTVFDQVENKLELDYQYLGEQTVKNIEKPLRVYRVLMQPRVAVTREVEKGKAVSVRRMPILLGAVTFLVLVVIVGIWWLSMHRPSGNLTSAQKMAYPLPDKVLVTVPPYNYLEAAVEIARLEKMLAAMDNKIATIKNDGLPALQTMVEEREKQQRRLDELRKKRQQAIARDIIAYKKIVSSPHGKDLKETAWEKLVVNYPEAANLAMGNIDVLEMVLLRKWVEPITGMEFAWVEGGCFQMGDVFGDGDNDEKPMHEVCIDSFGMSKSEVTQGQWQKIMGNNPSRFKGGNYPVEHVSWNDIQNFILRLNSNSGRSFRLPTEGEWEYAARSGGKKEKYAGGSDINRLAWYDGNSDGSTHPVGMKEPNGLGLYDMSGNVWEWCSDWYGEDYYQQSPRNNPQGPSFGLFRVIRDGCWNGNPWLARSSNRDRFRPDYRLDNLGFRLVLPGR